MCVVRWLCRQPDNFLVASDPLDPCVYMIDFGLAKKYRDMRTHQHFPYQENRDLTGTVRYTSINAHLGIEQSRRDDLESLGYVLLYFLRGQLPWQGMKAASKREKYSKISVCKMSCSNEALCAGQPDEFVLYLNYTRALQFDSKPDYAYLRGLFKDLLARKGWQHDAKYDWAGKRAPAAIGSLDAPPVPRPLQPTEISQAPAGSSNDARQTQRQPHSHSHVHSSPASAASPQQSLSASPPLSLSQQRAAVYGADSSQASPRDASPRQFSPYYTTQQQQQRMGQQQTSQLHIAGSPLNGVSVHTHNGGDGSRLVSQYSAAGPTYSAAAAAPSNAYQLSTLPSTGSPLPVPILHHVPALSFSHASPLSSMTPGGGFQSLPNAFPPLLLSPMPAPQPFPNMSALPYVPSNFSLPAHSPLHASFPHSPYGLAPLSPSTFASHPFFSPSVSPSSTTAATMGDSSSRLSVSHVLPPHSVHSSASSSPLSLHHFSPHGNGAVHFSGGHPSLSPSSYSNTASRSSLSSPLASPHFSSASASPYLTSASSNLSLSTHASSTLHNTSHAQQKQHQQQQQQQQHVHTPPNRSQLAPAAHFG